MPGGRHDAAEPRSRHGGVRYGTGSLARAAEAPNTELRPLFNDLGSRIPSRSGLPTRSHARCKAAPHHPQRGAAQYRAEATPPRSDRVAASPRCPRATRSSRSDRRHGISALGKGNAKSTSPTYCRESRVASGQRDPSSPTPSSVGLGHELQLPRNETTRTGQRSSAHANATPKPIVAFAFNAIVLDVGKCDRGCRRDNRGPDVTAHMGRWTSPLPPPLLGGSRNRDVPIHLFRAIAASDRRRSGQVARLIKRLHLRGLVAKIPRARRWRVTQLGQAVMRVGASCYAKTTSPPPS